MFYSQYILAKKGDLGRIWLAAHWDKKLTKQQVFATDIKKSVESILDPNLPPMALRMTGHLLLGVTRIYARKVKYILSECNEALVKIKMSFRPGDADIDLNPEANVANYAAITLPENMGEYEITLPDITLDTLPVPSERDLLSVAVASKRQITLNVRETENDFSELSLNPDEFKQDFLLFNIDEDEEGAEIVRGGPNDTNQSIGGTDVVLQTPSTVMSEISHASVQSRLGDVSVDNQPISDSPFGVNIPEIDTSFGGEIDYNVDRDQTVTGMDVTVGEQAQVTEPVVTQEKEKKIKKKRPPPVDTSTYLSTEDMKKQLADTSDIVREIVPAPRTKKAMLRRMKENAGVKAIFYDRPVFKGLGSELSSLFPEKMSFAILEEAAQQPQPESSLNTQNEDYNLAELDTNLGYEQDNLNPLDTTDNLNLTQDQDRIDVGDITGTPDRMSMGGVGTPGLPEIEEDVDRDRETLKGLSDRSKRMHRFLTTAMKERDEVEYFGLVERKPRGTVVGTFFELLVLKTKDIIDVHQSGPYQEIEITKGRLFNTLV